MWCVPTVALGSLSASGNVQGGTLVCLQDRIPYDAMWLTGVTATDIFFFLLIHVGPVVEYP